MPHVAQFLKLKTDSVHGLTDQNVYFGWKWMAQTEPRSDIS